jgi:hypothetical protein
VLNVVEVGSREPGELFSNPWEVEAVPLWRSPENATLNLATSLAKFPIGTNGPNVVLVVVVEAKPELEWSFRKLRAMAPVQLCQKLDDATPNNAMSPAKFLNGTVGPTVPENVVAAGRHEPDESFNNPSEVEVVRH